jgi:glycine dehydrogenase subunit 1
MRYLPLTQSDRKEMLATIGVSSIDELFKDVPQQARLKGPVELPAHIGEIEVERALGAVAAKNIAAGSVPFFLGCGAYRHHIPASVDHIIQRSEFLTSYTPYQPEIAQGTLQYLFEFQSMVAGLTGLEVANASLYDGSTAAAEAVRMAARITKREKTIFAGGLNPQVADTIRTTCGLPPEAFVARPPHWGGSCGAEKLIDDATSAIVVQTPSLFGDLIDLAPIAAAAHAKGALIIVVVPEIVSLGLIEAPGAMGADIVVAEGQSLGNAMSFGGPYVGVFAARAEFLRQMPGRLCGETLDAEGRRGYVLTISTREQHIRREKATSNICTNSGLCVLAFTIHLALLGEAGFKRLALLNHQSAVKTAQALENMRGVELMTPAFFNEFTLRLGRPAAEIVDALANKRILAGVAASRLYPDTENARQLLIVAATEMTSDADRAALAQGLKEML